jgi:adhesin transport system membrane fusion protein
MTQIDPVNADSKADTVADINSDRKTDLKPGSKPGVPKKGWDLAELDQIGFGERSYPVSAKATSPINFQLHGEKLEKKATRMKSRWVPLLCLVCVGCLIVWASFAKIDQVTRGQGKVIPSSKVQIIQSLENGVVRSIAVEEGEIVGKDQVVLNLDDTSARASHEEALARRDLIIARMSRLKAEANEFSQPVFPDSLNEELVRIESSLFEARREDYYSRESIVRQVLQHAKDELEILRLGRESMTKLDLIRAEREVTVLQGELETLVNESKRSALDAYDLLREELTSLNGALTRSEDILQRKVLRSPINGTVNKIHVSGEGGVISSGEHLVEIVPINDTLLVEANVLPEDIGFVHSNQAAMVKFTAFDFTVYGGMEGVVEYIGVDTVKNDQGETYYPIRIRTNQTTMGEKDGRELTIIPGMVAEIDILAGQKSVLQYLLNPLNRARQMALTEQ